ncbi:hypothetical protein CAPTEDRAFT_173985 [Capitella teleta]|uniref:Nidogen n=1 Tax=Capitella teleta TaxID=283909 RepID=R7TE17_CAPTE|nr:hypothetical protein CAPTEDRAFT_173985 [Capitella teleta]|eukprot:ELT91752.1 hypothetical protein CAPTEDRAFT_173985 [Capitella teleta]
MAGFRVLALICLCVGISHGLSRDKLFPFGADHGDRRLEQGDDISSTEIALNIPVAFYDQVYYSIFVNCNGHLSLETEVPDFRSNLIIPFGFKIIAPFFADVDTSLSGYVYYRETQDQTLLALASRQLWQAFPARRDFQPRALFIVTWDQVGYYKSGHDKTNTFQVVLASDGRDTFSMFLYPEDGLNWVQGQGKSGPSDVPGQVGFDAGDADQRRYFTLPASGNEAVKNLVSWTNTGQAGLWIFRIGQTQGGDIESPGEQEGQGMEKPTTCADGGDRTCHSSARCEDFENGFCCRCQEPAIGNGKNCVKPSRTQRVSGKFSGAVNGIIIEPVDMHAYVIASDGRTYTAISRMNPELGTMMQAVFPVGGILGWLFAVPKSPMAKNGFMLTGGDFNRTASIQFNDGGHQLTIRQTAVGNDVRGHMLMNTVVEGNIPQIPVGTELEVDDYKQEYTRARAGEIRSRLTHTYRVNGVAKRFSIEQIIRYEECPAKPMDDLPAQRLYTTRNFITYNNDEQVVRFTQTNRVSTAIGLDPCREANILCDSHASCVLDASTGAVCVCREGYAGDGTTCYDIDECRLNTHDCHQNAQCYNTDGGWQCRCLPGYIGDGKDCYRQMTCEEISCDVNARCEYDENQQAVCVCNTGFSGDGHRCRPIVFTCNEVNNCDENAECAYDYELRKYTCQCNDGFSGDGLYCSETGESELNCEHCHEQAECLYDADRLFFRCQCSHGYSGDGYTCYQIGRSTQDSCDVVNNCDYNARCVYDDQRRSYSCQCNAGYHGDGLSCEAVTCDVTDNCDINAECRYDSRYGHYRCVCNSGYLGDGTTCQVEGCNVQNFCDSNAQCLLDGDRYVCRCNEGFEGDGRVCRQSIVPCNQVNNCDINAECLFDPNSASYTCACRLGYEGDGFSCRLTADCQQDQSICDGNARCVPRGTDYVCICNPGFRGDGYRCAPLGDTTSYLLYSQGDSIFQVPFSPSSDSHGKRILYAPGSLAVGIDADCYARYFYWTDVYSGSINRAKLDGSGVESIVDGLQSPEGVAVDWVAENIYWTDSESDSIEVSRFDGSSRKVLFNTNLEHPRAIAVDPIRGVMFWTDWNRDHPKVERSYMDGSERMALVESDLGLPNGLVIDFDTYHVCWADAGTQRIECVNYEGRGRRIIYDLAPYSFDLAYDNQVYYWTDWDLKSLLNINQFSDKPNEELVLPQGGNGRLYGLTTVKHQCPGGSNACAVNNGGCRFLCLPTPNGARTCLCPDDVDEEECNSIGLLL